MLPPHRQQCVQPAPCGSDSGGVLLVAGEVEVAGEEEDGGEEHGEALPGAGVLGGYEGGEEGGGDGVFCGILDIWSLIGDCCEWKGT